MKNLQSCFFLQRPLAYSWSDFAEDDVECQLTTISDLVSTCTSSPQLVLNLVSDIPYHTIRNILYRNIWHVL